MFFFIFELSSHHLDIGKSFLSDKINTTTNLPFELEKKKIKNINFRYPHTISDNDTIKCEKGFFGDDPITSRGCWSCSSDCHKNAECRYPGFCSCNIGYEGNGIDKCQVITPLPIRYKINHESKAKYLYNISYTGISPIYEINDMYCRINNQSQKAKIVSKYNTICETDKKLKSGSKIELSYNGKDWGESITIDNLNGVSIFSIIWIIIGVFIGISAFVMLISAKPGPIAKRDEVIPLKNDISRKEDFPDIEDVETL